MIWLKSILVGLAVLISLSLAAIIVISIMLSRINRSGQIFWNPLFALKSPLGWLFLALVFAVGFGWEYHRLAR